MRPATEWCAAHSKGAPAGAWLFAIVTVVCGLALLYGAGCTATQCVIEVLR